MIELIEKTRRVFDSAYKTSSGVIFKGACMIKSIVLSSGAVASSIVLYDGVDVTSDAVIKLTAPADDSVICNFTAGIVCNSALFLSLSGTGAGVVIVYAITDIE